MNKEEKIKLELIDNTGRGSRLPKLQIDGMKCIYDSFGKYKSVPKIFTEVEGKVNKLKEGIHDLILSDGTECKVRVWMTSGGLRYTIFVDESNEKFEEEPTSVNNRLYAEKFNQRLEKIKANFMSKITPNNGIELDRVEICRIENNTIIFNPFIITYPNAIGLQETANRIGNAISSRRFISITQNQQ